MAVFRDPIRVVLPAALAVSLLAHAVVAAVLLADDRSAGGFPDPGEAQDRADETMPPDDSVRLGIDESKAVTIDWLGFADPRPQKAPVAATEQAALAISAPSVATPQVQPAPPPTPPAPAQPPTPLQVASEPVPPAQPEAAVAPPPSAPALALAEVPEAQPAPAAALVIPERTGSEVVVASGDPSSGAVLLRPTTDPSEAPSGRPDAPEAGVFADAAEPADSTESSERPSEAEAETPPERPTETTVTERPAPPRPPTPKAVAMQPKPPVSPAPPPTPARPPVDAAAAAPRDRGLVSDRQADATVKEVIDTADLGGPIAFEGFTLHPVRPELSTTTTILTAATPARLRITFLANGKVDLVQFDRDARGRPLSTGSSSRDFDLENAVYRWRATGRKLEELLEREGPEGRFVVVMWFRWI